MTTTSREQYREVLAALAAKARAALPDLNGRVDGALKLVLAGDVELLANGTAQVASSTDPLTKYLVNGTCPCRDFDRAPSHLCRHRLAAIFARRAQAMLPVAAIADTETTHPSSDEPDATTSVLEVSTTVAAPAHLPEAPASVNCHITIAGRQVQLTLRDTDEDRLLARLTQVLQRFPVEQTPLVQPSTTTPQPPVCQWHGRMKESTKAKNTWYCPAKMGDGSYCKERWPAKAPEVQHG